MSRFSGSTDLEQAAPTSRPWRRSALPAGSDPTARTRISRTHVLTVALEDYYRVAAFRRWIREETWYRFEDRLQQSTRTALDLLDKWSARATFFVGCRTADSAPDLVREVSNRGHEIASWGEFNGSLRDLRPETLREEALRCREQLEQLVGRAIIGFRMSTWLGPADLWVLDLLAECGYRYDSSISPALGSNAAAAWRRSVSQQRDSNRCFHEVPVSSLTVLGLEIPIARGGSFRHFPPAMMRRAIAHWHRNRSDPYVMCFRTWELDPEQPRISAGPLTARIRHYRNLHQMPALLEELLSTYRFTSVASHLEIEPNLLSVPLNGTKLAHTRSGPQRYQSKIAPEVRASRPSGPMPVTVIIPCYNETQSLRYLRNTLQSLAQAFHSEYVFTFLFVDDGSTDGTWPLLQELFGGRSDCRLLRHDRNRGVAHAIQTGIRQAQTQIVCSIDCDCTYDPHELGRMIPLLTDGVDLVTASPYHPAGAVRNVPRWRLFLSKGLSRLYRLVLHQKLFTYTSCFRVYRRHSAAALEVKHSGFLGVAELLAQADLAGRRIIEYPATLEVRVLGRSKMKIVWTILGHLSLVTELVRLRLSRGIGSVRTNHGA